EGLREPIPGRDGQVLGLEPETPNGPEQARQLLPKRVDDLVPVQIRTLASRLFGVAAIGQEERLVRADQDLAVRSGEAGEVARVEQSGDEQRIDREVVAGR